MDTRLNRYFSISLLVLFGWQPVLPLPAGEPREKRPKMDRYGDPLPPLARLRLGTTRFRHAGEIIAVAFAPDGRRIATLGRDDVLNLWDAASGKALASFPAPDGVALAFGERGKALLWCDARGRIYRCDAGSTGRRQHIHTFDLGSSERINTAVFTANGSAAAATSENRICFWGKESQLLLYDAIQTIALDRAGKRLAVNNGHKGIYVRNVDGPEEARGLPRAFGTDSVRSLAFSSEDRILAAGDFDNRIHLWDTNTLREVHLLEGHHRVPVSGKNGVFCLDFSPNGTRLASGAADGTVRVWEVKSGKELACCTGHGRRVRALAFAPDGRTLASAGADNALRLWDPATGRAIGPMPDEGGAVLGMSVSPDGKLLALVQMPGQSRLWDVKTGKELPAPPSLPAPIAAAVFAPKGHTLVRATVAGHLHFWDCDKREEPQKTNNIRSPIRLLAAANDGATVAWCGYDHRILLWDAQAGKEIQQFRPPGDRIAELTFRPDGKMLLIADSAGVSFSSVFPTRSSPSPQSGLRAPDSKLRTIVSGGILTAAVSPDGRMAATGGQDDAVRLWEIASGKQRRVMYGDRKSSVHAAAFSIDGTILATGSSNGFIRLWDVGTGQRLHSFAGHRGGVVAVAFAGPAATLITAGADGTALIWDLPALLEAGRKTIELSTRQVQALWRDLADTDTPRAYEAIETLVRAPSQAVPFLREQVSPVTAERLARRIRELDSDDYPIRVRAVNELAAMGTFAEPKLRQLIAEKPSLEARRRAEELLALLDNPSAMTEHLRTLRAVEVLERIGTYPARQTLQLLAEGAAEAALTRETMAALARLKRNKER